MTARPRLFAITAFLAACNSSFAFDKAGDTGDSASGGDSGSGSSGSGGTTGGGGSAGDGNTTGGGGSAGSSSGAHGAECASSTDCTAPGRLHCDIALGRCVECDADADCGSGLGCNRASHVCIAMCFDTDDCPWTGQECERGACTRCDEDRECAAETPATPHCMPGGARCVECVADADCASATPHCDPVSYECVACRDSRDCAPETACDATDHTCR
jgi:hypothetical protein